ncbi:hypothetical protein, partial [Micromonospora sp. b486]|uniref:hypothetical protein n=1 Tax=Micromonospora sp. b486 TaxID=3053986 RepID=UPI00259CF426
DRVALPAGGAGGQEPVEGEVRAERAAGRITASIRWAPTTGPPASSHRPGLRGEPGYGLRVVTVSVCPSAQLTSTVSSRASQSARTSVTSVQRAGAPG